MSESQDWDIGAGSCFVEGIPQPKGSMSAHTNKRTGFTALRSPKKTRQWVDDCVIFLTVAGGPPEPLDEPVTVDLRFYLQPPMKPRNPKWSDTKPDLDKLIRAVLDALEQARWVKNDSRFCVINASKEYSSAKPGVLIEVSTIG